MIAELTRNDEHRTTCAYKGHATHWDVGGEKAIAWSYELPLNDAMPVRSMVVLLQRARGHRRGRGAQARPHTQWG